MLDIKELYFMNKDNIQNSSDMFLYKAIIDLNSGKYLLEAFNNNEVEIDIEKIYFELQQSAEKLLKSLLSNSAIDFPKSHDLEQIIELCENHNIMLVENIEYLIELNDYAVEGRYSMIHDDINEADRYIDVLEKLITIIESKKK
jgi:HEPN domain-containing protein